MRIRRSFGLIFCIVLFVRSVVADTPPIYDSEQSPEKPISGAESTAKIQLPDGMKARLFAAEPKVRNPIALQYDSRGRLWIAENYTYAERGLRVDPNLRDRLVIFEDRDFDGVADKIETFSDQLSNLTGFAIGRGGVWAICPPQLLFLPDRDKNDIPDTVPQIVLDGFLVPLENHHNFANGLKFGPDGWLYGRSGGSSPSEVGQPGADQSDRVMLRGGIWRYHPESKRFEVLAHGTTNPWGMDWDEHGEAFFVNTVNGHLWHLTAGSHLDRLHTIDPNPDVYQLMRQTADHYHFDTGQGWSASRDGAANHLGGGHAHQGALIYQGNNWPAAYRGRLLTVNFHGRRLNTERLELTSAGFVGRHEKDFALFGDTWFRGIDMAHTPQGNIVVIDWSDTGECHENTGVHRSSGRIYELGVLNDRVDPPKAFDKERLIDDLMSENVYIARRAISAVYDDPRALADQAGKLRRLFSENSSVKYRLRGLWALNALGDLAETELVKLTHDSDAHMRTWAIRFLLDHSEIDSILGGRHNPNEHAQGKTVIDRLVEMAQTDASYLVRLTLASALQRLPSVDDRSRLAIALTARTEDAGVFNQVQMVWYGIAPMASRKPEHLVTIARGTTWPSLQNMIARRLASEMTEDRATASVEALLSAATGLRNESKAAILQGMTEGLAGREKAARPKAWEKFTKNMDSEEVRELSALFGDGIALQEIRRIVLDDAQEMKIRENALRTLIRKRPADLSEICSKLLSVRYLNAVALQGLTLSTDLKTADVLIRSYRNFSLQDRPRVIDALGQRPAWAQVLMEAVASGRLPRQEISVLHVRQMRSLGDSRLNELIDTHWGRIGTPNDKKLKFIREFREELEKSSVSAEVLALGRTVYMKNCGQCHTLYGEGGKIGPDITGAQRQNFDYLMENILEPSAVVSPDFRLTQLALKDGRVLSGMIRPRDQSSMALVMPDQTLIVSKAEISEERKTDQSIMPEGQLEALNREEGIALIRYLMTEKPPAQ